jgi:hypothetical protein
LSFSCLRRVGVGSVGQDHIFIAELVNGFTAFVDVFVFDLRNRLVADRAEYVVGHSGAVITVPLRKAIIHLECSMPDRDLFIFGCFAHDPQDVLATVQQGHVRPLEVVVDDHRASRSLDIAVFAS